ncbi:24773_t:CDS:10 [Racocetra persica]|uniref:24773_t:CDS:1 n=1 Tax=Racocetra persica TaxID=160502 RepID=A0ACA9PEL6_9GLOM|nr:24773_t:CDS:10 [Racocetra persica]
METSFQPRIYNIAERRNYTPNFTSNDYETNFLNKGTPLIIDNGSYQCRVGWATDISPRLQFDNLVSKYKDRKINQSVLLVGNDVYTDATAKTNAKSAFDGNVVYNFETMESVLDYIFIKLGINTDRVNHPILMTEPVCNPSHSRKLMTELLFECYRVPSVCYGIDALFSFHFNELSFDEGGIVISSGHTTTHVIPAFGRSVLGQTKRISYGGLTSTDYMLKLMQLKYPTFPTKMTVNQAQHLVHNHTYVAEDYFSELKEYTDPKTFAEKDRIIQFPYVPPANEKSEEELARAEERRQEQARRLKEQAARLRHQKGIPPPEANRPQPAPVVQNPPQTSVPYRPPTNTPAPIPGSYTPPTNSPQPQHNTPYRHPVSQSTLPYPPQGNSAPYPPQGNSAPYPPQVNSAPYPPQGNSAPYPPQGASAPYPPQGTSAPYPPQGTSAPYPPPTSAPYPPTSAPYPPQTHQGAFSPQTSAPYPPQGPQGYPAMAPPPVGGHPQPPPNGSPVSFPLPIPTPNAPAPNGGYPQYNAGSNYPNYPTQVQGGYQQPPYPPNNVYPPPNNQMYPPPNFGQGYPPTGGPY